MYTDVFTSAKLNDDGSVTYVMTKAKHKELMREIRANLDQSIQEMADSEDYSFSNIQSNDDYTIFTVSTSAENKDELSFTDSFSVIAFYMYGGIYNTFNGTPDENIHVDFVNENSGELITSADSKDMDAENTEAE